MPMIDPSRDLSVYLANLRNKNSYLDVQTRLCLYLAIASPAVPAFNPANNDSSDAI